MSETLAPKRDLISLTAELVGAYVSRNNVPPASLPGLLQNVHAALTGIATGAAPEPTAEPEKATPAQVRKSITPNALISFVDGKPYKSLKRHLAKHGLDVYGYRERYGLPSDYPTVSANYSEARKSLAKSIGLGRPRKAPETEPEPDAETAADAPEAAMPARRQPKKSAA